MEKYTDKDSDWYRGVFFIDGWFSNDPAISTSKINDILLELVRNKPKNKKIKNIKDSLLTSIINNESCIKNKINSPLSTFTFYFRSNEFCNDENQIVFKMNNRYYSGNGFHRFMINKITYIKQTYELIINIKKNNNNNQNEWFTLNLKSIPLWPAPMWTPINPREETITQLQNMGFTNELIDAFDQLVHIFAESIKLKSDISNSEKNKEIQNMLTKHTYAGKKHIKYILISTEDVNQEANFSIITIFWREGYQKTPALDAPVRDKFNYKQYFETLPNIRW
jgi:hypothetical protein